MTQYPLLPDYPLSHPVDPNAPSGPYVPILYHVDADTQRFISPLTWRPPLMAQALPHIRFSAITTFKIKPYSNRVPLIIDTQSLVLVRIADRDRTPVHSTYATASEEGYYTVTLDLVGLPANDSEGQGFIELSINDVVLLSDRCTLGTALWPYGEQPRFPYETIYNVEGGDMVFTSTPSMYQLPPVPSTQPELDLTVTPSGSTVTNKLLFYSEAPSLIINVDGATLKGDYVGPGWYCALMVEEDATITLHLSQLTDLYTESINAVRGFNPILVEDEWPTYGRRDSFYIHATTREARIWTGGEWYPVGSSDYKYAPKSDTLPLPTGTASKGIEEKYAAGDHVHPFSIELTTNHLDTAFTTPTDTNVPSSKLVKDTIDQVQSDLEEDMITLTGEINDTLSTKVDKVTGKELSTNDLTNELLETLEGSEQKFNKDLNFDTPTNGRYPSTLAVSTALDGKVDKVTGKGLSTNDLTNELMDVISGAEQQGNKVDTLLNPGAADYPSAIAVNVGLSTKVDKVTGKGLSTNDYTTEEKNKVATINGKVDKVEGKGLSTNDLTDALVTTINGSEQASNKATTLDSPDNTKYPSALAVSTALDGKVDKVEGKDLSTNDLTDELVTTINGKVDKVEGKDLSTNDLTDELVTTIDGKVDKVAGKGLSTNDLTNELVTTINGSEQTSNKATTLDTPDNTKYPSTLAVSTGLSTKVDKVDGKVLSDNNYTTEEKNKLASAIISLPDASPTAKGVIELATSEEVTTGEDSTRAVVPSTLKTELDKKVDKETGYSLSKNDLTDDRLITLNGSEQTSNKATTLDTPDNTKYPTTSAVSTALSTKVDKVTGKTLSTNDYTTEEKDKVATIQNETLTTINGITAEIEPWSRSRWTIQGDCEFTLAEEWNDTGMETAYILLTVRSGALLAGPSSVIFDNSLDQGEGVYEVELVNLDGVIHFRWTSCQIFNAISFRVTTTTPSQTYTLTSLGLSDLTDIGWGDGTVGSHTGTSSRGHVYATPGTYEVRILPAENIVLLNLQGALVSEVNSVDLKAASNMEYLYLRDLTNAIGVIDTVDMVDWPMTQYFYLYNNPLLSIDVDSAHMVGWNPTVIYLYKLTSGNTTINTENMVGWTNLEILELNALPTLGGSLDTLHFAGWSNFRSITLYILPAAFSVRLHTEDLIELPIQVLHLYDYDGRNTVINTTDLSTKTLTYLRLFKLPLSVVTVNSADMRLWNLSYLYVSTIGQATGTINFADLAGSNISSFIFIDCPLLTFIEDRSTLLSWTSLALFQISSCTFSTEQMDRTLYYLYTAAPYRTVTEGIISFGGTSSSAPSGVYEAPDCPVTSSTPGRGIAYALKNDPCSVGFNKWATVTIK